MEKKKPPPIVAQIARIEAIRRDLLRLPVVKLETYREVSSIKSQLVERMSRQYGKAPA